MRQLLLPQFSSLLLWQMSKKLLPKNPEKFFYFFEKILDKNKRK